MLENCLPRWEIAGQIASRTRTRRNGCVRGLPHVEAGGRWRCTYSHSASVRSLGYVVSVILQHTLYQLDPIEHYTIHLVERFSAASRTHDHERLMNMREHAELPPQPTSSLKQLDSLVGEWTMVGTHPAFPSAVHGHSSFEWLREGALLVWHFEWERPGPPSALSVIGRDDSVEMCSMLYADERSVARVYQMSLEGGVWKMWRDAPGFSQRMTGTFSEDGNTIIVQGELSRDRAQWEQDLGVTYTRKQ